MVLKERIKKNSFAKNFLFLFSASFLAQLITLISSPILTRMYSPEDFGVFSFYLSIIALLIVFVTGSYEYSINTIKSDKDSYTMIKLILIYTLISVFIYVLISQLLIAYFISPDSLFNKNLSIFIALTLLITGMGNGLRYFLNRKKEISVLSKSNIYNSVTNNTLSILLGLFGFSFVGLIISHLLANLITLLNNYRHIFLKNSLFKKDITVKEIIVVGKEYKEYPLFNSFSLFFNGIALQAPILIFMRFFTESLVGFYSLTIRAIGMPLSLISATLSQVFLSEISERERENKPFKKILIKTLFIMFIVGIVPLIIIVNWGQEIFIVVFGEEWRLAGEISQIIIFSYYFKFIISPLSVVFYVKKKTKLLLKIQFLRSLTTTLVLLVGSMNFDFLQVILFYTIHECAFYLLFLFSILKISK